MCYVVQAEPQVCPLPGGEEVEVCCVPVSEEIGAEVPATAATTGNNNTQPQPSTHTDSQEHGEVSTELGTDDTATALTTDNSNTQPSTNTDISLEHGTDTAVLGTGAELRTRDMTTAATTDCLEPSVAGTSTLPELGELAVVAGISSDVSSGYTVAEETCLEDVVADACSGDGVADTSSVDGAADTSSVDGAARLQHSSDQCQDSENNNCNNQPNQPWLSEYKKIHYPKESCTRDFNPEWFKKYQWLEFNTSTKTVSCFACLKFSGSSPLAVTDWKNLSKNVKTHAKSEFHQLNMMKWMEKIMVENDEKPSVASQLSSQHAAETQQWRLYVKTLFENIAFLSLQGLAMRGNEEPRQNMSSSSSINRGNFIELLSLRAKDIPVVKMKIETPVKNFGGGSGYGFWTSGAVQNEMISILSSKCLEKIVHEIKSSDEYVYSIIVDETTDLSKIEQFSLSISYLTSDGVKKERFLQFIDVKETTGEYLNEKLQEALIEVGLDPKRAVSIAADGASNMSGDVKGLVARFREVAKLCVYTHCYAHVLNLVVKDLLTEIPSLQHVMGVLQSLYNYIEARSTKRHNIYLGVEVGDEDGKFVKVLKNQSATRWSMRHDAVDAVLQEFPRVVKCLGILSRDKDPVTASTADSLLKNVFSFKFIVGITMLNTVLTHTTKLSDYLQGRNLDIRAARDNVQLTINTLESLRTEAEFNFIWKAAENKSSELQKLVDEDETLDHEFVGAKVPRSAKWAGDTMSFFRVTEYFPMLDKIINQLKFRLDYKESRIVYDLASVIEDEDVSMDVLTRVADHYNLDADLMSSEQRMFNQFKVRIIFCVKQ